MTNNPSILIIRLSSLGDIILTTSLLQGLRKKYPAARIDLIVKKEFAGIASEFPWLSNIFSLDTSKGIAGIQEMNAGFRKIPYDHVLDLHYNFRSRRLRRGVSGIHSVIDKRTLKRWLLVKTKINMLRDEPDIIGRYFETAKALDVPDEGNGATFGREFDHSHLKKAALCPGAKHWNKRWPQEYFLETAKALIAQGFHIEFFGSADEYEYVNDICSKLPREKQTNLCGKLTLGELPSRIAECSLAITNDSGLMHVASATGVQTISLFGPTVRELGFMPRNNNVQIVENLSLDCRPCTTIGLDHCPKGHFKCMKDIHPKTIMKTIDLYFSTMTSP